LGRELCQRLGIGGQVSPLPGWAFIPVDAQPVEDVDRLLVSPGFDARAVQVLYAQYDPPAALPGQRPVRQERARVAQVQRPCGRRRKPRRAYAFRTAHAGVSYRVRIKASFFMMMQPSEQPVRLAVLISGSGRTLENLVQAIR